MYTVVRELPPGRTPWARANSCADFEPGSAHCAVRARARGDLGLEAIAIASFSSRALALPSERRPRGAIVPPLARFGHGHRGVAFRGLTSRIHYGSSVTVGREASMNGAESLVRTLVAGGVNVCFTNPGTSEMHFVAALDRVDGMRCVLCLFE